MPVALTERQGSRDLLNLSQAVQRADGAVV
jgi:hypothetical protein